MTVNVAAVKLSELPVKTTLVANDKFLVLATNTSPMVTSVISVENALANTNVKMSPLVLVLRDKRTPANSAITIAGGTAFFDDDYFYISTANNVIKRIALTAF